MTNDQVWLSSARHLCPVWGLVIRVWSLFGHLSLVIGHLFLISLLLTSASTSLAANFIYHEQSTRSAIEDAGSNDCVGAQPYVEVLSPASGQPYSLRFRVEYHSQTDQARVYYTTDGSTPIGSLGNASNSTRVIVADYFCTASDAGNTTDLCRATIPGQLSGTTVKYLVSAWSSGDGVETFGNSGTCIGCPSFTNSAQATSFQFAITGPPDITSQPQNRTNILGTDATFFVNAAGLAPLTYQWFFNATNAIENATNSSLLLPAVQKAQAGDYFVVIGSSNGAVTSSVATLTVVIPPSITQPPASLVVTQGASANFAVVASGDAPLSYRWRFNGNALSGEVSSNYVIANVKATNAGNYDVIVSNNSGSVTSQLATLTVLLPASIVQQPVSLTVTQGGGASFAVAAAGDSPLSYQWRFNGSNLSGATASNYTIASAQATNAGNYNVVVSNASGSVTSQVASLTVLLPASIVQQPISLVVTQGSGASFRVTAAGDSPLGYQWRLNGNNLSGAVLSNYTIAIAQATNSGNYDVVVSNNSGSVTNQVATLTVLVPPSIAQQPISLTVTQGGSASFSVTATGDAPLSYQWRFNGNIISSANASNYIIASAQVTNAGSYDLIVSNSVGSVTSQVAVLTILVPPSISQQPVSLIVTQGSSTSFSVAASGDAPLSYQWRYNSGNISNANASSFSIPSAQGFNGGLYDVVISNNSGSVTSSVASLIVRLPPSLTAQPTSLVVTQGQNASFSVVANGDTPIIYQWFFNNTNALSTGTNATLLLSNTQPAQAGPYYAVVSNSVGVVTSQVASLTVLVPPFITQQPASLTVTQNQSAAFSVVAGGDQPLSYQWRINGADIIGSTNSSLTIPSAQPTDAGNYQVLVVNPVGSVTSTVATLTVAVFDFGDAPPGYPTLLADDGARHRLVPGYFLGNLIDSEPDGQPSTTATGDDSNNLSDDDGVTFAGPVRVGQLATAIVVASTNGLLQGWIDFNANTNWSDAGEQVFTNRVLLPGTNQLTFLVPANATAGLTFARFRFSTDTGLLFVGPASNGEVEDYALNIQPAIDLGLTMTASPNPVLVGSNITYVIAVTNRGPSVASAVTLTDLLPDRLAFVSATPSQGSCAPSGGTIVCGLGSLGVSSNATVLLTVRTLVPGLITNQVTTSASEFDVNLTDNSAVQVIASVLPTRTFANQTTITVDALLTGPATPYPSTIVVSGMTAAVYKVTATLSNLSHTFPDDLDILLVGPTGRATFLMSDAGLNFNASGVTLTFDDDAATPIPNSDQLVSGTFRPANYLPNETMPPPAPPPPYVATLSVFKGTNPNGTWSLYVFDDTSEDGGSIGNGWSLSITTIDPISDLAVTQKVAPNPGAIGTNVSYTITVTNLGPVVATGVKLTDTLPAGVNFISLSSSSGSCTNDQGTITCGWDALTNGAGALVTLVGRPVLGGMFTNIAVVSGQQLDVNSSNNVASTVLSVTTVTDLAIAVSSTPQNVLLQQPLTYTVLVTNLGPNAATGVLISDVLPAGITFISATPSRGSCSNAAGAVTCALGGLLNGASASITIVGQPSVLGLVTNVVTLTGDQFDNSQANNTASAVNNVVPAADLGLTMIGAPQPVGLGQILTYSLTVSNAGPSDATSVLLTNALPPNISLTDATPTQGACTNDGAGNIICGLGALPAGATAGLTLRIVPLVPGSITNTASLASAPADPVASNNTAVVITSVVPLADLAVSQSAFPSPVWLGDNVTYTAVITNNGPSAATSVIFRDTFPTSTTLISATPSQGSCSNQAGTITCNLGQLNSASIATVTVIVQPNSIGTITNRIRANAFEVDLNSANNLSNLVTSVITPAGSFSNNVRTAIPEVGPAVPYPSTIFVSGLTAAVQQVRVTLTNLSHSYPDDLDILLVAPNGAATLLMSDVGGESSITNVSLRFDDQALQALPDAGPITSGSYRPTDFESGDIFPPSAPTGPYGTNLTVFNGMNPNGPWSLYIVDDAAKDRGSLDGWSLDIAARDPIADLAIVGLDLPPAVAVGSNMVLSITVSNAGPSLATQGQLIDQLPLDFQFQSVTTTRGSCTNLNGVVHCNFGTFPSGSNAVVSISIVPANPGAVTNVISVLAHEIDLNLSNNVVISAVAIENPPVITLQPQSQTITNGESVVLTASATGTEPLVYQWQRNGANIPDATNTSLALINAAPANAGAYRVRVSNRVGVIFSDLAILVVLGPPQVSDVADQVIDEDTPSGPIPFTIGDAESPAGSLLVAGSSSNPTLIPDSNIIFGGTGSNRTVRLFPATNQFGTAVISIHVTDPDGGVTTVSFLLTVQPVNDPPVILPVADQATPEDTPAVIAFTVDDPETLPASLLVTAASSNPALVPAANLVLGGSDNNRTLTAIPLPDQFGSTVITLVVTDEVGATGTNRFVLTVTSVNDPPTLAPIGNLSIDENAGPQTVSLTGITSGASNEVQRLRVTATSGQPSIISNPTISYTSPNTTGTLTFAPLTNANGTVTITVTVDDGQAQNNIFSQSFSVEVRPVNAPPTLSTLPDQSTPEDTPISLPLAIGDDSTLAQDLVLSRASSNLSLVPQTNIVFGGTGPNRTVTITPATNQFGTATITLTVADTNGATASTSFVLTVNPVNDPPTLDPISNRSLNEDASQQTNVLTGITSGATNEIQTLTVTASSSNPALIPTPTVTYTNGNSTGTLRYATAANANGTALITVTVNDNGASNNLITRTFTVTVNGVNDPPSISGLTNISTPEDVPVAVPFTISDLETAASVLTVTAASSNTNLVPNAGLLLDGAGTNRTLFIVPASDQSGTATISLSVNDGVTNSTASFVLTVAPVNDPPTLDVIPDTVVAEGAGFFNVNFSGVSSGSTNESQTLSVSAVSSNTTLVTVQSVTYSSPATSGSVRLRTSASGKGTAVVAITVNDGVASNNIVTRAFTVFLKPSTNTSSPTMSAITNRTILEDTSTGPIAFTVNDTQTPPGSLTLSGRSSNPVLVPPQNIVFAGSGGNRTVNITPATNQFGTTVITVSVLDSDFGATNTSFTLTVSPVNDPPRISTITNQSIAEDTVTVLSFTVDDPETPAANLVVTAHSTNQTLLPDANLRVGGSGTNRALSITPATNQNGTSSITVTVSDGVTNSSRTFLLTVTAVNDPPIISSIADQTTAEDTATAPIAFTVSDIETSAASLSLSAVSSNPTLVSTSNIVFGGSGSNRTVRLTPTTNEFGNTLITVTVTDAGSTTTSQSFLLTVTPVNDVPTLDAIADLILNQNAGPQTIQLSGIGSGAVNESQTLSLSASVSDPTLLMNVSINYTNPGSIGTLTFTPVPGASGSTTLSVTVNDGQSVNNLFTRTFSVTITQPPTISDLPDQTIDEDNPLPLMTFTIGDLETPAQSLIVTGSSSDPALVPNTSLILGGAGPNRTLTLLPATNAFGTGLITLTVTDAEGNSTQASFLLTINPIPDVPSITLQPQSQIAIVGAPVTFQVLASSTLGPLQYQWQHNGADLPGQTSPSLLLSSAQSAESGQYRAIVSNPDATVPSAAAQLYVLAAPRITQITRVGGTNHISFPTIPGPSYTIEYNPTLAPTNWTVLITVPGTGDLVTVLDAPSATPHRFYRLLVH